MKKADWQNRAEKSFTIGKRVEIAAPLNGKVLEAAMIVSGTLHIANDNGVNGVAIGEGILNLAKRIKLRLAKADGSRYPEGTVVDLSARSIMRGAIFQRGKFIGELYDSAAKTFAPGDYDIYIAYTVFFADPNLKRKIDTALNLDETAYRSAVWTLETGTRADCAPLADRTWTFGDLKVQLVDRREAATGDTYVLFQEDHLKTINGAKERDEDASLPTDGAFIDILLMAQKGAAEALADDVLKKVELSGDTLDLQLDANDIRQAMFDQNFIDADQTATGLYLLNFCMDGMLTQTVPASRMSMKLNVANPSGAGLDSILVRTRRVFAPDGYQPIA